MRSVQALRPKLTSALTTLGMRQDEGRESSRRRDKIAKQKALISAATALFAEKGYAAVRTSEVAALAGCAEGLIHRYFGGKPGLLLAILRAAISLQEGNLLSEKTRRSGSLGAEAQRQVQVQLDHLWEIRDFLQVGMSQALIDPGVGASLDLIRRKRETIIAQDLRQHMRSMPNRNRDVETMAKAITALTFVYGFVRPVILGQKRSDARKQILGIIKLISRSVTTA